MLYYFASRTGNTEALVSKLGINAVKIETGEETAEGEFIIFTYTDGFGDVPFEVESFLSKNSSLVKGVVVTGDTSYGEAYGQAGDKIASQYNVPLIHKCENDGTDEDVSLIKEEIKKY